MTKNDVYLSLARFAVRHPRYTRPMAAKLADNKTAWERHWRVLLFATRATRDQWPQNLPITKLRFVIPNEREESKNTTHKCGSLNVNAK